MWLPYFQMGWRRKGGKKKSYFQCLSKVWATVCKQPIIVLYWVRGSWDLTSLQIHVWKKNPAERKRKETHTKETRTSQAKQLVWCFEASQYFFGFLLMRGQEWGYRAKPWVSSLMLLLWAARLRSQQKCRAEQSYPGTAGPGCWSFLSALLKG